MLELLNLFKLSEKFDLKFITIKDLIEYRMKNESLINEEVEVNLTHRNW